MQGDWFHAAIILAVGFAVMTAVAAVAILAAGKKKKHVETLAEFINHLQYRCAGKDQQIETMRQGWKLTEENLAAVREERDFFHHRLIDMLDMLSNAGLVDMSEEAPLEGYVTEALAGIESWQQRAEHILGQLRHYQYEFVPACKAEADRWHDMWQDAVIGYGNAQDIYERALESAYKQLNRPMPPMVIQAMKRGNAQDERMKIDCVAIVTPDPKLAFSIDDYTAEAEGKKNV